jgi:hypothetical protein
VNPRVRDAFPVAQQSFDVFVTVDQNLEYQQNVAKLTLVLVIVAVPDNNIKYFRPIFIELQKAAESIRPGQIIHVVSSPD